MYTNGSQWTYKTSSWRRPLWWRRRSLRLTCLGRLNACLKRIWCQEATTQTHDEQKSDYYIMMEWDRQRFLFDWRRWPAKWRPRNESRNSILMTRHYPDLGSSASDWSCRVGNLIQPIRSTTQIWVVTRHQYGISALVSQTSFGGETSGSVAKCRLFSQATVLKDEF